MCKSGKRCWQTQMYRCRRRRQQLLLKVNSQLLVLLQRRSPIRFQSAQLPKVLTLTLREQST